MTRKDRSSFNTSIPEPKQFKTLIDSPKKKKVVISGENSFGNDALGNSLPIKTFTDVKMSSPSQPLRGKKRGRPTIITDERYKVVKPKKISAALESKLNVLQDYIVELQSESGRITFEKVIDTLAEAYIKQQLSISKEEHVRNEIQEEFDKLK